MKKLDWGDWVVGFILVALITVSITASYAICNQCNPDSRWCMYEIYRQSDGTYQVWWVNGNRGTHKEGPAVTYEEAKALQIKLCKKFLEYEESKKPTGKRVP